MHSKQLHYFVMTVRKGSIAAAARALDIAQPAISQQLASLEREMKATLLERSFSGVNLTSAGEIFYKHALKLLTEIDNVKAALEAFQTGQKKVVKIGMLPSIGNVLSLPLLTEITANHKELKVEISTGPSYTINDWLESKQVDVALTYQQAVDPKFMRVTPLIQEDLHLVFSASSSCEQYAKLRDRTTIRFWEISELPLLSPGNKDALGQLIADYEKATGVSLQHDLAYSGQLMTGLRQVMQGEGVMILPTSAIFHLKESGLVSSLKITQPEMQRTVLAATNKSAKTLLDSSPIIDILRKVVAQENALKHWCGTLEFAASSFIAQPA
ncbi:LysR family transcriptional regulator [Alteromonas macleodii]|uniref:LysR family transcriptional regulator n=1 Tax=Alteromonas macleodii TaxID=28108 RepID=UPI0012892F22|nr:LysR family transcriptional regulator [Alteromonas macleodii]CAI2391326.1 LysR family [Alteromonas macleodii]CAI3966057.1 LysR family [Alteromonas macleodii]CAI3966441.1 LysR family [Alteromonas macleodii]CAI3966445.1 LysR family [Alteromonas macleodii]VTO40923.1 LysR family [Alteromonas macleodii]